MIFHCPSTCTHKLDGLERRVDGAVLLSQKCTPTPHLLSSSKPRSHVVQHTDHQDPSPQRGAGLVKHRSSGRRKRGRQKEKENEKKAKRMVTEADEERKEESTVTIEGPVLNSDSQLNETFTVSPELQQSLHHSDPGAQESNMAAREESHGPPKRVTLEQPKEPTEALTSPRRAVQTTVTSCSLQRTNKSAVFGPPISFKDDAAGKDVPERGRQERRGDRQQDRGDEVPHCCIQLPFQVPYCIVFVL